MALTLLPGRVRSGIWEAILVADQPPAIEALHDGTPLPGLQIDALARRPSEWLLRLPIPMERLSDGVQTFVMRTVLEGQTLGHFSIVAGADLDTDLRAEMDLLRAELDLLKRAFRRHAAAQPEHPVTPRSA